jgi:hypothetical protein
MSPSENEEIAMNGLLCAAGFSLMAFFASCGVGARVVQSDALPVAFIATPADVQGIAEGNLHYRWIVGK